MRGFIIVNDRNLSDIFLDNLNARSLARLLSAKIDVPDEISSIYHGKHGCVSGVTLWKDPVDGDFKVSHAIMIPHSGDTDEHALSNISSAVSKVRDIANAYYVSITHDGDVFLGFGSYCVGEGDGSANHYDELVRLSKMMDEYNVPVLHYFLKKDERGHGDKVLIIAKTPYSSAALSVGRRMYEDGETLDKYKHHLQNAEKYILARFLASIIKGKGKGKLYIRRANIL